MVPNLHAKLASLVGLDADATDSQILEAVRNLAAQRDTYRELAQAEPWRAMRIEWAKIPVGAMIEHDGRVWTVTERQRVEGRRVKVTLWRGGKTFERFYRTDDVANVLELTAMVDALRLVRRELGATILTPEEVARSA